MLIVKCLDYHDIEYMAASIASQNYKGVEIGFDGSCYIGILYQGRKPSKAKIAEELERCKISIQEDDDE